MKTSPLKQAEATPQKPFYMKYERLLRKLRQRIFDYDGTDKEAKAARVLAKVKARHLNSPEHQRYLRQQEYLHSEAMLRRWA